jgi:magnesium transporter
MTIATVPDTSETRPASGVIACALYEGGRRTADLAIDQVAAALTSTNGFVWVGLYEPSNELLSVVQGQFDLHDLAVEDALKAHQRPKLEIYDETLFVVLRTAQLVGSPLELEFGETHIFVGPRFVVSVRHGSLRSHVGLRTRCEGMPHLLAKGPGYVLYALMDFVVDQFFPIVDTLEEQLEQLEEEIFGRSFSRATTGRIYELKRNLLAVKRAVSPLIDVCNRLARFDVGLVPEDTRLYFRDVYDHAVRINDMVDNTRELLTTALEANLSLISVSQNEDTKRLAAWAAIIAVPTMIAGIYGMNFRHMPELEWSLGYPLAIGSMLLACAALFAGFKRSGWL